jgi:hypothetical protein
LASACNLCTLENSFANGTHDIEQNSLARGALGTIDVNTALNVNFVRAHARARTSPRDNRRGQSSKALSDDRYKTRRRRARWPDLSSSSCLPLPVRMQLCAFGCTRGSSRHLARTAVDRRRSACLCAHKRGLQVSLLWITLLRRRSWPRGTSRSSVSTL